MRALVVYTHSATELFTNLFKERLVTE